MAKIRFAQIGRQVELSGSDAYGFVVVLTLKGRVSETASRVAPIFKSVRCNSN